MSLPLSFPRFYVIKQNRGRVIYFDKSSKGRLRNRSSYEGKAMSLLLRGTSPGLCRWIRGHRVFTSSQCFLLPFHACKMTASVEFLILSLFLVLTNILLSSRSDVIFAYFEVKANTLK